MKPKSQKTMSPNEELVESFKSLAKLLEGAFPNLEWDLKRAAYTTDAVQYISETLAIASGAFILCVLITVLPFIMTQQIVQAYAGFGISVVVSAVIFIYHMIVPKIKMSKMERKIDKHLEYMLKDMQIQLTSGVPLFDTLANIAVGGYGECSNMARSMVREVQSGKSMTTVLDDAGMTSPSEYMRRVLWQIVNAVRTGSDVTNALKVISNEIQQEKENKIKIYGQELNLFGLIYMMLVVVAPSMGVTLLVILSSFIGGGMIGESLLWMVLIGVMFFQIMFITMIRSKRPDMG